MTIPAHDSVAYLPARPRLALLRKEADQLNLCLPCPRLRVGTVPSRAFRCPIRPGSSLVRDALLSLPCDPRTNGTCVSAAAQPRDCPRGGLGPRHTRLPFEDWMQLAFDAWLCRRAAPRSLADIPRSRAPSRRSSTRSSTSAARTATSRSSSTTRPSHTARERGSPVQSRYSHKILCTVSGWHRATTPRRRRNGVQVSPPGTRRIRRPAAGTSPGA